MFAGEGGPNHRAEGVMPVQEAHRFSVESEMEGMKRVLYRDLELTDGPHEPLLCPVEGAVPSS